MFNGDVIHDNPLFLSKVKRHFAKLDMPVYASRGNHDRCSLSQWRHTWNDGLNYSFERGNAAFIVLDTSDENGALLCPDAGLVRDELQTYAASFHACPAVAINTKRRCL